VNKNLELQAAKMVTHFDRKDCFPHNAKRKKDYCVQNTDYHHQVMQLEVKIAK
jgi:hypothetical protein